MALQSKMTVYVALAGVLVMMGGIIYYASLDNVHLEQAQIKLQNIKVIDVDRVAGQAKFDVVFLVENPSEKTFTVASITYQLFDGDGMQLGTGQYSVEDIALPGRAVFYPGAEVPLKSILVLSKSEMDPGTYEAMINGAIPDITAQGMLVTQTSWSTVDIEFMTDMRIYD